MSATPLVACRLDPAVRAELDRAAAAGGITLSDLMREAIEKELARRGYDPKQGNRAA